MKLERLIRAAQPKGFRWKVIGDGKTLDIGSADTEAEAREAAETAIKRIGSSQAPDVS